MTGRPIDGMSMQEILRYAYSEIREPPLVFKERPSNQKGLKNMVHKYYKSVNYIKNQSYQNTKFSSSNIGWKLFKKAHFRWPGKNPMAYKNRKDEVSTMIDRLLPIEVEARNDITITDKKSQVYEKQDDDVDLAYFKKVNKDRNILYYEKLGKAKYRAYLEKVEKNKKAKTYIINRHAPHKLLPYESDYMINHRKYYKRYINIFFKKNPFYKTNFTTNKSLYKNMIPGIINNVNAHLIKNSKKIHQLKFHMYKFLFNKRRHAHTEEIRNAINETIWNHSNTVVEQLTLNDILYDDTKNTHKQGLLRYDEFLSPALYDIAPSTKIQYAWDTYNEYLPVLALKHPFRFEGSRFFSYRILSKLIFAIKKKKYYDLFFSTGTHKRVKVSSKNLWEVERKLDYGSVSYNRLNSFNINRSFFELNDLSLFPINNCSNNFLLDYFYKQKDMYFFNPILNYVRERLKFFYVATPTYYSIDRLMHLNLTNSSIILKAKNVFHSFFLRSFFSLKKVSFPFKFFRILSKKFFKRLSNGNLKDELIFLKNNLNFNKFNKFLLKKRNLNFFSRVINILNSNKSLLSFKHANPEKTPSLYVGFKNHIINKFFFSKFHINSKLPFMFSNFVLKDRIVLKKHIRRQWGLKYRIFKEKLKDYSFKTKKRILKFKYSNRAFLKKIMKPIRFFRKWKPYKIKSKVIRLKKLWYDSRSKKFVYNIFKTLNKIFLKSQVYLKRRNYYNSEFHLRTLNARKILRKKYFNLLKLFLKRKFGLKSKSFLREMYLYLEDNFFKTKKLNKNESIRKYILSDKKIVRKWDLKRKLRRKALVKGLSKNLESQNTNNKSFDKGKKTVWDKPNNKGKKTVWDKPNNKGKKTVWDKPNNKGAGKNEYYKSNNKGVNKNNEKFRYTKAEEEEIYTFQSKLMDAAFEAWKKRNG